MRRLRYLITLRLLGPSNGTGVQARPRTDGERAAGCARRRAEMGDEAYEAMCRGVAERVAVARAHRLAAEAGDWSWRTA